MTYEATIKIGIFYSFVIK